MSEYPNVPQQGSGSDIKVPILIGAVVALLGANVYLYMQLDKLKGEFGTFTKSMQNEVAGLKESSSVSTQTARRSLNSLKDELETARRQAAMAAGQARVEAQKHAEELAKRVAAEQAAGIVRQPCHDVADDLEVGRPDDAQHGATVVAGLDHPTDR